MAEVLKWGSRGQDVVDLQSKLNDLGFLCGAVDGIFGRLTFDAVISFQITFGIIVDGIVGPQTRGELKKDGQVTRNFNVREFKCPDCGSVDTLDRGLILNLQWIRDQIGRPLCVSSGYRCGPYNAKVGGAPLSQHQYGRAADVYATGVSSKRLAQLAEQVGFNGLFIYSSHIHVDTRAYKVRG